MLTRIFTQTKRPLPNSRARWIFSPYACCPLWRGKACEDSLSPYHSALTPPLTRYRGVVATEQEDRTEEEHENRAYILHEIATRKFEEGHCEVIGTHLPRSHTRSVPWC
jgi:hypothetical protein